MAKKRIFIHKEENYDYTFDNEDKFYVDVKVDEEKITKWEASQKRYEDIQEELAIIKYERDHKL